MKGASLRPALKILEMAAVHMVRAINAMPCPAKLSQMMLCGSNASVSNPKTLKVNGPPDVDKLKDP